MRGAGCERALGAAEEIGVYWLGWLLSELGQVAEDLGKDGVRVLDVGIHACNMYR